MDDFRSRSIEAIQGQKNFRLIRQEKTKLNHSNTDGLQLSALLFALFLEYAANVTPESTRSITGCGARTAYAHLPLALQFRRMSSQLIFQNSFVTVELIGTGSNLCVTRIPVFKKPPILFFLSLQQTEQDFLDGARTGRA